MSEKTETIYMPSLFLAHGAPDLAVSGHPTAGFLARLGENLPKPRGIVVVSAHWETRGLAITGGDELETIHDFFGFPEELYKLRYPASGARWLVDAVQDGLRGGGFEAQEVAKRGLDHGAWVPLLLAYPQADIPVVQLSLDRSKSNDELIAIGRALEGLRAQNILIIGSGGLVHNLRTVSLRTGVGSNAMDDTPPEWAQQFENWLDDVLQGHKYAELAAFEKTAPNAAKAHPTVEHFLPLLVAVGAGGADIAGRKIHSTFSYGSLSMACWAFEAEPTIDYGALNDAA